MSETLEAQLRSQLTAAMKAKDQRTANLVRMINTKIRERRTAKDFTGQVDDTLVLEVINTNKKQMEKARGDFVNAGDKGKAQVEELDFELDWCTKMLPQAIGEDELRSAVATAVASLPSKDPKMAGRIMGAITKQYGDRADAQLVKKLAEEALS